MTNMLLRSTSFLSTKTVVPYYVPVAEETLLEGETDGLAIDFTDTDQYVLDTWDQEWNQVRTASVDVFSSPHVFYTQSGTSPKYVTGSTHPLEWSPHNLITQSQTIGSWSLAGAGRLTVTDNATTAPDGTSTAEALVEGTNAATTHWADTAAITLTAGFAYTWSCYLKPNGRSWVVLNAIDDIADNRVYFDVTNGTIGTTASGSTATITAAGNGWYFVTNTRVSVGGGAARGGLEIMLAEADNDVTYTGDGTSGVYAWGAQVNRGYFPTAYISTVAAARIGLPISYGEGLLVEPAATNVVPGSQSFGGWNNNQLTMATDNAVAPDGSTTAERFTATATNDFHEVNVQPIIADTTHTSSVYLKDSTARYITFTSSATAGVYHSITVDLQTVAVTQTAAVGGATYVSSSIVSVGNGWYRVSMTGTSGANCFILICLSDSATPTQGSHGRVTFTAAGTEVFYAWGVQKETGTVATSYVPTVAATATRAIDNVTVALSAISPQDPETAGTMLVGVTPKKINNGQQQQILQIGHGANNDNVALYILQSTPDVYGFIKQGGSSTMNTDSLYDLVVGTPVRIGFAWAANDGGITAAGQTVQTDASVTVPSAGDTIYVGIDQTANLYFHGFMRTVVLLPRRMSDANLVTATSTP